jgi:hypothetical protein
MNLFNKRMFVGFGLGVVASSALFIAVRARAAGVPDADGMTYSGYLEDGSGAPLTGDHSVSVHFYSAVDAKNDVCAADNSDSPQLVSGRFQIALPSDCTTAAKANPDLWVEVEVDGGALGRTKIAAVPYALEAAHATTADTAALADDAKTVPTITEWKAFTPKWKLGAVDQTNVMTSGFYRRVGDSVEVQARITELGSLTNATGSLYIMLPDGLVPAAKKLTSYVDIGIGHVYSGASSNWVFSVVYNPTAGGFQFGYTGASGSQNVADSTPFTLKTGGNLELSFTAPVDGWTATSR